MISNGLFGLEIHLTPNESVWYGVIRDYSRNDSIRQWPTEVDKWSQFMTHRLVP